MKRYLLIPFFVMTLSGCSTIKDWIPSFWDDNQSRAAVDVRHNVAILDCKQEQLPQVKRIKESADWLFYYSDSKGNRDIVKLIKPMQDTIDDFYKRSQDKQGSEAYCEIKKKILTTQSTTVAKVVLGRF